MSHKTLPADHPNKKFGRRKLSPEMTAKQRRVWEFYVEYWHTNKRPPTFRDAQVALGYRDVMSILQNVEALIRKGKMRRLSNLGAKAPRSIVPVVDGEEFACPCCGKLLAATLEDER